MRRQHAGVGLFFYGDFFCRCRIGDILAIEEDESVRVMGAAKRIGAIA